MIRVLPTNYTCTLIHCIGFKDLCWPKKWELCLVNSAQFYLTPHKLKVSDAAIVFRSLMQTIWTGPTSLMQTLWTGPKSLMSSDFTNRSYWASLLLDFTSRPWCETLSARLARRPGGHAGPRRSPRAADICPVPSLSVARGTPPTASCTSASPLYLPQATHSSSFHNKIYFTVTLWFIT